jgi:hypothetical protein
MPAQSGKAQLTNLRDLCLSAASRWICADPQCCQVPPGMCSMEPGPAEPSVSQAESA